MSKWSSNFQLKRSKISVTKHQKPQEIATYLVYIFTYGQQIKCWRLRRRVQTVGLTIVRHNLLSTPELLSSRMDGCISCQHSTPTSCLIMCKCVLLFVEYSYILDVYFSWPIPSSVLMAGRLTSIDQSVCGFVMCLLFQCIAQFLSYVELFGNNIKCCLFLTLTSFCWSSQNRYWNKMFVVIVNTIKPQLEAGSQSYTAPQMQPGGSRLNAVCTDRGRRLLFEILSVLDLNHFSWLIWFKIILNIWDDLRFDSTKSWKVTEIHWLKVTINSK